MGLSKLAILALTMMFAMKAAGVLILDPCFGYQCGGCKCIVRGHGYNKRPYCQKPRDPCDGYNKCAYGAKCVSYGSGCRKQVKCVTTDPCANIKCGYRCKCLLSGYGYNQKAYCDKPRNRCNGYLGCPPGTKCQSYGNGCYTQVKCVPINPCYGYKCQKGCKCLVRGYGYNKTPYCEKPKNVCYGYKKCSYGCKCLVGGYGCSTYAYCQKPNNPCSGYNVCPYGTKCKVYGSGCYKKKRCVKINPCIGYYCAGSCKCKLRGYGYNKKPYCETPKNLCSGYNVCPYGTKCKVTGHGCYKKKRCVKINPCPDPCNGYSCPYGSKCVSQGYGCYKTAKCINTNPCVSYICSIGCICRLRGYGNHQTPYCDKPKDPCDNYPCPYGAQCQAYGDRCGKVAKCITATYNPQIIALSLKLPKKQKGKKTVGK